ncbi:MAG: curli production assembly/transport component CsgF [Bacteroidota bacterium]
MKLLTKSVFCIGLFLLGSSHLGAQDLVYRATNPAFGGNYLNYSWLLNSANAQNNIEDPAAAASSLSSSTSLESFTESLNRQLLNQISRDIFNDAFGSDGLTEGIYEFGDFQVEVIPGVEGLIINIIDFSTGGQSTITVPYSN